MHPMESKPQKNECFQGLMQQVGVKNEIKEFHSGGD